MLCASFVVQYKVVLGSASCKLCSAKLHWGVLCANFVVPSSTGKCFVHFVLQSLHKALPSTTLYYKVCTKHFPVLLGTTKFAQSTPQCNFALQSLHEALPSTTLYCTTKLAQSTSQYFVLQSFHKSKFLHKKNYIAKLSST